MRIHSIALPLLAAIATALAQTTPTPVENSAAGQGGREAALDNLLSERESAKALDAAIADARKSGVSEQAILEARFLYHVDRREDAEIAALLPEFLKRRDTFVPADSAIFAQVEDWLAVVEYVQAIDALGKGGKDAFKKHITEAFWLSPRQASAFAPHIERLRLEEAMRAMKIDFTIKLARMDSREPVALETLVDGKKALLFHFWSPMSQECEAAMQDFAATALALSANGISVVSLISDNTPKLLEDARAMVRPLGDKVPCEWLIDSMEKPLGRDLRIQDLPAMVLVSPEGAVLFNGEPTDERFWQALGKIDARNVRPKSATDGSE